MDVETTSYALLALTALSDIDLNEVNSIVRWLLKQRNPLGGFISSQVGDGWVYGWGFTDGWMHGISRSQVGDRWV